MKPATSTADAAWLEDPEVVPPNIRAAAEDALRRAPFEEAAALRPVLEAAKTAPVSRWNAARLRHVASQYAPLTEKDRALAAAARQLATGRARQSGPIAAALDPERTYRLTEQERERLRRLISRAVAAG